MYFPFMPQKWALRASFLDYPGLMPVYLVRRLGRETELITSGLFGEPANHESICGFLQMTVVQEVQPL